MSNSSPLRHHGDEAEELAEHPSPSVEVGVPTNHRQHVCEPDPHTRAISTEELYFQTSAGIQLPPGRLRKWPTKRARNDQSRGRPITPMNRR